MVGFCCRRCRCFHDPLIAFVFLHLGEGASSTASAPSFYGLPSRLFEAPYDRPRLSSSVYRRLMWIPGVCLVALIRASDPSDSRFVLGITLLSPPPSSSFPAASSDQLKAELQATSATNSFCTIMIWRKAIIFDLLLRISHYDLNCVHVIALLH